MQPAPFSNVTDPQDRYITEREACHIDGMSSDWHRQKRVTGDGPPFIKVGRSIRYHERELREWFAARKHLHTSQYGGDAR